MGTSCPAASASLRFCFNRATAAVSRGPGQLKETALNAELCIPLPEARKECLTHSMHIDLKLFHKLQLLHHQEQQRLMQFHNSSHLAMQGVSKSMSPEVSHHKMDCHLSLSF